MFVSCEGYVILQVEASATGRSLVQGSPTEYGYDIVCDDMQQQPSATTIVRYTFIGLRKEERRKNLMYSKK
jgi:hypothetical protein